MNIPVILEHVLKQVSGSIALPKSTFETSEGTKSTFETSEETKSTLKTSVLPLAAKSCKLKVTELKTL